MEIERKFLIKKLPENLSEYTCYHISQGYISTDPVLRIRQKNDKYILTYKSQGMMSREEHEFPLTKAAFMHLLPKVDNNVITKDRYIIPIEDSLIIELDIFKDVFQGFVMAEVEFPSKEAANAFIMPNWFKKEVTFDKRFHNSTLSKMTKTEISCLINEISH